MARSSAAQRSEKWKILQKFSIICTVLQLFPFVALRHADVTHCITRPVWVKRNPFKLH